MDAKRKSMKAQLEETSLAVYQQAKEFRPDLIFLGDDEAGDYIGKQFLDTSTPLVFWGFNDTPVKYGLVDTTDRPGHNVTGVYQSGYYIESLRLLKSIVPGIRTFAILTDASPSGRAHQKGIEFLVRNGALPVTLTRTIATNSFEEWKSKALELQGTVDAFFIAQYSTLKNENGEAVPNADVALWYRTHIKIPEATVAGHFVRQGMLCAADDSGYNQAYEAVSIANDILSNKAHPATYPARAPKRGLRMVNRQRAAMLNLTLTSGMGIEAYVDAAESLPDMKK
jgi:ABC-type uncharacterized transport system substrate-binding protein